MKTFISVLLLTIPSAVAAQVPVLTRADSLLAGRILRAEDRRDSIDSAITEGSKSTDPRIRLLAQRARGRIADPGFAARAELPALPDPPAYADPAWRIRYRALTAPKGDCGPIKVALADSAWPVRLHATDLIDASCATDDALVVSLRAAISMLPADASRRQRGGISWHAAAHSLVALARTRPDIARGELARLATHRQWQVRAYTARAAGIVADTTLLRKLVRDANDDVQDVAITALSKITGHTDDDLYLQAIKGRGAQAVRAGAVALKGSPRADVPAAATMAFDNWAARNVASARDARLALLDAANRPATDDRPPTARSVLPAVTVPLALGADIRLRVTLSDASGGGSFDVRLRGDNAPIMAARILSLVRRRYYNGLTWHRVEPDFVIQGGSPGANEYVGATEFLRDELGNVPHVRGTIGMSTRGHDTGDAQWFVNLRDNRRLDKDYTLFAEVTDGIDIVDGVLEGDTIATITELPTSTR